MGVKGREPYQTELTCCPAFPTQTEISANLTALVATSFRLVSHLAYFSMLMIEVTFNKFQSIISLMKELIITTVLKTSCPTVNS